MSNSKIPPEKDVSMSNDEDGFGEVARILKHTAVRTYKMPVDAIIPAFDEAEALCLPLVSSEEHKLEVKRRVAEWKIRKLCLRPDAPFETVELLRNNLIELGYAALEKCVMSNDEDGFREVARILEHTAVSTFKMPVDAIIPAFDKAEALCLLLVSSEEHKLEVKRRVAEWKLGELCLRPDTPFETVELLRNNLIELGYTNLEKEATMEIYFAKYCERQGHTDHLRRALHQILSKLDSALKAEDLTTFADISFSDFKKKFEDILSRIDKGSK